MGKINGFTLVELLAVIVILGIVALVTTPAILNVVNDSRIKGAEDKAWGIIDAVKLTYAQAQTQSRNNPRTVVLPTTINFASDDGTQSLGQSITITGDKPISGTITIDEVGFMTAENLVFTGNGRYTCSTNSNGTKMCCKKGTVTITNAAADSCS